MGSDTPVSLSGASSYGPAQPFAQGRPVDGQMGAPAGADAC